MRKIFEFCFGVLYFFVLFKIIQIYTTGDFIPAVLIGGGYGGFTGMIYEQILKRRRLKTQAAAQEDAA